MAGRTGLEPATSDVTGRRSNQLNYHPSNLVQKNKQLRYESGGYFNIKIHKKSKLKKGC